MIDRVAVQQKLVGDDAAVASPPDGFQAHQNQPPFAAETNQFGLAREMWRAPTEEPGGVLWETGADRRRNFVVKRCGLR